MLLDCAVETPHAIEHALVDATPAKPSTGDGVTAPRPRDRVRPLSLRLYMNRPVWMAETHDDAWLGASRRAEPAAVHAFFRARAMDPTSYFYRYAEPAPRVELVAVHWLQPHEASVSKARVQDLRKAIVAWHASTEPLLLVDRESGAILDGHDWYHVAQQLARTHVPAVLVHYVAHDAMQGDVWPPPGCGRAAALTKHNVVARAFSSRVIPPETSRHRVAATLPPISTPLSVRRQAPVPMNPSVSRLRLLRSAHDGTTSWTTQWLLRRLGTHERVHDGTQLELLRRPSSVPAMDSFLTMRAKNFTSSFGAPPSATWDDLRAVPRSARRTFFLTRLPDPTSYFYKYHVPARPHRQPKRLDVSLASVAWLKPHEAVVSWDRVDGLRRATLAWQAYLEPLLVDRDTGAILDGHHRYHVAQQLGLASVPVVVVDYLADATLTVDVWPECGRDTLTKAQVLAMALSDHVFPPKTSRHAMADALPPISIPLAQLRVPLRRNYGPVTSS
ncbi:hypothetical protein PsorP6_007828 [Peronosclerospora sorghi]|uniref:Uncharacterized protein n=1 Tax=Peronosclerospora sorghi TaxID=230839 RepID=A0ACC0W8L0_9STRA|nr:hypothetical protein PsorP6_007828 [Peronosclerospora sorghi]